MWIQGLVFCSLVFGSFANGLHGCPRTDRNELLIGDTLYESQGLFITDSIYCQLCMQGDGNLVLYNNANRPTWASNTRGPNVFSFQTDHNLVVVSLSGHPKFSLRSYRLKPVKLVLTNKCLVELINDKGEVVNIIGN